MPRAATESRYRLSRLLLSHAPEGVAARLTASEALETALSGILEAARQALPKVRLSDEAFIRHLAQRLPARDPGKALEVLHAADLYLACACAQGDRQATVQLESAVLPRVRKALGRVVLVASTADDVTQMLRVKLLLGSEQAPPRIAEYSGRGPLARWASATAVRMAIDLNRLEKNDVPIDEDLSAVLPMGGADPELQLIKDQHRAEFKQAFGVALQGLSARDRSLLRMHLLDGLSYEQIGAFYRVDKSSVSRWLSAARAGLLEQTRKQLESRLGLKRSELDSLMKIANSQLDFSLSTFLRKASP